MSIIDRLAEEKIQTAIEKGEFENLPGRGKPLVLDDDRMVPEHLRTSYRMLKNAGFVPPELEQRKAALKLCDLLGTLTQKGADKEAKKVLADLQNLELKMRIQGIDTQYLCSHLYRYINAENVPQASKS